jgi:GNAT superfamily N-acetyltransferase
MVFYTQQSKRTMPPMPLIYRPATPADIAGMAEVRAGDWGTAEYWRERIARYLSGELTPREALPHPHSTGRQGAPPFSAAERVGPTRVAFVCAARERVVGLIAGHLTRRFGCDGELEWISVRPEYRGQGIASELLRRLAEWFLAQEMPYGQLTTDNRQLHPARRICVDVEPTNHAARRFYARHGAVDFKPHWMVWDDIGKALASAQARQTRERPGRS